MFMLLITFAALSDIFIGTESKAAPWENTLNVYNIKKQWPTLNSLAFGNILPIFPTWLFYFILSLFFLNLEYSKCILLLI